MRNEKKSYAIVLGIFALVIVTTTASFAFFRYSRVGNTTTTITSGEIAFTYKEGESAELASAFPVSDDVGATDTTEEYTFDVSMSSTSDTQKMRYNVYLLDSNNEENVNYFNNDQIKFALLKNDEFIAGTSETAGLKLSEIEGFGEDSTRGEGIVVEDEEISSGDKDTYKLRIWISDDVNYSNTVDGQDEQTSIGSFNGYKYSLKVKVTSEVVANSIRINDVEVKDNTITAELNDVNGLSAYAITQSSTAPAADSDEWITITSDTAKSNVVRTTDSLVTTKSIRYTVTSGGTYYIHVKNKLDQLSKKVVRIATNNQHQDESGANRPVLKTGMIPVTYNGNNWVKADTTDAWYDYDNHEWANVVTVSEKNRQKYLDAKAGTTISMDDINTMWVWIPRFEYETITATSATEIKVNFLTGTESNKTSNYITHPAFTFGDNELTGFWVAKFEASSNTSCTPTNYDVEKGCDVTTLKVNVKPNATAWRGIRVSTADLNTRAMNASGNIYGFLESEVDTHVMRNMEWGAVAYLTQSKYGRCIDGKCTEVTINSNSGFVTGYSNSNTYEKYNGVTASTTGNIYGVYDMSGGAWEYVMGVIKDNASDNPMSGNSDAYNSGYKGIVYNSAKYTDFAGRDWPDSKYYDLYEFGTTYNDAAAYARSKTGDATTETKGWYGDYAYFANAESPWFGRGGNYVDSTNAGVFVFHRAYGNAYVVYSFRPVLVQK